MNKTLSTAIKIAVFFGLGILLVWLSTKNLNPADRQNIIHDFRSADYRWVVLTMLIGILSHLSRSMRWNMLIRPMGYNPRLINTFCAVMIGYLVNFGIPRGGEVTRCGILARYEKIPVQRVIGSVVTERAIDVLLLIIVFFLGFLVEFTKLNNFVNENVFSKFHDKFAHLIPGTYVILLVVIVLASIVFMAWRLRHLVQNLKLYHHFLTFLKGFLEGIKAVRYLKRPWLFVAHSIFIWIMYLLMVYVGFFCLPQTSVLTLSIALAVLAVSSIAMLVTPGGFGLYPILVASILAVYGIANEVGQAIGWILWGSQFVSILLVGVAALVVLPLINTTPATVNDGSENVASV